MDTRFLLSFLLFLLQICHKIVLNIMHFIYSFFFFNQIRISTTWFVGFYILFYIIIIKQLTNITNKKTYYKYLNCIKYISQKFRSSWEMRGRLLVGSWVQLLLIIKFRILYYIILFSFLFVKFSYRYYNIF